MKSFAHIAIHSSQFPENVRRDLLKSLRTRRVNHKFHYDSVRQTQKWLALHQIYSPTRNDKNCRAIYENAFEAAATKIKLKRIHVVGLGCGGGQKDARLLRRLKAGGKAISYTPCDVSLAMVLVAREAAMSVVSEKNCFPFVRDLATTDNLPAVFNSRFRVNGSRITTFFGMIPNFEPQEILSALASIVRPGDLLLFSANLAPGKNYAAGVKRVLPQYDNQPTRDWLMTFLFDLGVRNEDGRLELTIETGGLGLKRIVARFHLARAVCVAVGPEQFEFRRGESIRLFFSYRYTPALVRKLLGRQGLEICDQWITQSEEEGVFLCRRKN